jgi:hypothetical protein
MKYRFALLKCVFWPKGRHNMFDHEKAKIVYPISKSLTYTPMKEYNLLYLSRTFTSITRNQITING